MKQIQSWVMTALFLFTCVLFFETATAQTKKYIFENLGKPVRTPLPISFVTHDKEVGSFAWGSQTDAEKNVLVGVNVVDGSVTTVDFSDYGKANSLLIFKKDEQFIYLYAGKKGRFFKFDIRTGELRQLGEESNALYWMRSSWTIDANGLIYVGTYPRAAISVLNPHTDETFVIDRISTSKGSEYVINPASSKDGIIYFPTGMHHGEIWSYNPKTEEKKQILPEKLMTYGAAVIWQAEDGNVYGRKGSVNFMCTPDSIVEGRTQVAKEVRSDNVVHGKIASYVNKDGDLVLEDPTTKETTIIPSQVELAAHEVFSIGDIYQGKLYGSTMKPGNTFSYDLKTGKLEDLGLLTRGRIQVYDILTYQDGMFMSSYTGGFVDYLTSEGNNSELKRKSIANLHAKAKQERLVQLTLGPDRKIYAPTVPIKGHLGGVLTMIDPKTMKTEVFHDLVHNQSFTSVTAIPETNELFITSSINGGSSAKPTEKESYIILWDTKLKKRTHQAQPIPGSTRYGKTVLSKQGLIYGTSKDRYYVFDPIARKTIFQEILLPSPRGKSNLFLSDQLANDGLIYGIDATGGRLFSIDPVSHAFKILAENESLIGSRFAEVRADGYLYYSNGASLFRVQL